MKIHYCRPITHQWKYLYAAFNTISREEHQWQWVQDFLSYHLLVYNFYCVKSCNTKYFLNCLVVINIYPHTGEVEQPRCVIMVSVTWQVRLYFYLDALTVWSGQMSCLGIVSRLVYIFCAWMYRLLCLLTSKTLIFYLKVYYEKTSRRD